LLILYVFQFAAGAGSSLGKVELNWFTSDLPVASSTSATAKEAVNPKSQSDGAAIVGTDMPSSDTDMPMGDTSAEIAAEQKQPTGEIHQQQDHEHADLDVAEDEDRWMG
jgi:hypothetical protein